MDIKDLAKLSTEAQNPNTLNIDSVSTLQMVEIINEEDKKVAFAVEKVKEQIAKAIDVIGQRLSKGGNAGMVTCAIKKLRSERLT